MNIQFRPSVGCIVLALVVSCGGNSGGSTGSTGTAGDGDSGVDSNGNLIVSSAPPGTVGVACEKDDAPTGCGSDCAAGSPCEPGTYCNINVCAADCTPSGGECSGETECNNTGRCVSTGTGTGSGTCADVTLEGETATPNLMFLVDNSSSMNEAFGETNRWDAVRDFLVVGNDSFVAQREAQLKMGISLFTSTNNKNTGNGTCSQPSNTCPQLCTVGTSLNNFDAISDTGNYPEDWFGGGTPTGDSMNKLVQDLVNDPANTLQDGKLLDADGDEFVILLATDGIPDRCENGTNGTPESLEESESAAQAAFDVHGIRVFVLFVGKVDDTTGQDHLNRVACLGVGEEPACASGDDRYFEVENPQQLSDAINEVVTSEVVSCTVSLKGELVVPSGQDCPNGGTLTLRTENNPDGQSLSCGSGWEVVDKSTIEVLGSACDALKQPGSSLTGQFPCGAAKVI